MTQSRNYGIDLFRIISMYMVVTLHVIGQGGLLDSVQQFSPNYFTANFFEVLSFGAVDCFALISGYVGINSRFRFSNVLSLWRKAVFYTIGIAAVYAVINPNAINANLILESIFPVFTRHYWYLTEYFCLLFLIPFLNKAIDSLKDSDLDKLTAILLIAFSIIPTVSSRALFYIDGYSVIWLAVCYYLGAYIKKRNAERIIIGRKALSVVVYVACISITYLTVIMNDFVSSSTSAELPDIFLDYTSPTVLLASIIMLLFFANLHIGERTTKIIKVLSPLSFSVYLIHCNSVIWDILKDSFSPYADISAPLFILLIILSTILIYTAASAIDFLRAVIENKLKLKERIDIPAENKLLQFGNYLKKNLS